MIFDWTFLQRLMAVLLFVCWSKLLLTIPGLRNYTQIYSSILCSLASVLFIDQNPFSNYNTLLRATVSVECHVSFSLSFRCQLWALSVYKHGHRTATVSYLWSGFSKRLLGWLHKKKASFTNSTLCTVWTRQLLSAKDKQTDRERRQRERGSGRREQRGRHENMRAGEGAKQNL